MKQKKKILVVDDDVVIRRIISFNLEKRNFEPLTALNGHEAVELLNHHEIDLIFCDIEMKDFDGYEFFRLIRSRPRFESIPFIFITSHSSSEQKIKAYSLGADDFISKPFNIDELILKTETILKRVEIYKSFGKQRNFQLESKETSPKILLVDDEPFLVKILQINLENAGFICKTAHSATEGMALAHEFKPDFIVSDYNMPGIDGFGFRKMLLSDKKLKTIPFAFLTSNDEDNVMLAGYDLDIKDYLLKTTNPKVLVAKIKNLHSTAQKERNTTLNELKEAATNMSLEMLPESAPTVPGFIIEQWHQPFKGIPGGDFLDFLELPDGRIIMIVGDVMGKKWGAWFYAFSFISYFRSTIRVVINNFPGYTAKGLLQKVNETIYTDSKISEIFSSISLFILDAKENLLTYSGAGDLPPLHYLAGTRQVVEYTSEGLLLGAREDGKFNDTEIKMNPGDRLIVFTDGIPESQNAEKEAFGLARAKSLLEKHAIHPNFIALFKEEFINFTMNDFGDDVSLLSIRRE